MLRVLVEAILLGIVQGIAEFAPISSSAHLIIVPWFFRWDNPALNGLAFDVALHLGTLTAVFIYFRDDLRNLVTAGLASIRDRRIGGDFNRKMAWMLVLATIPAVIVGVLIEGQINEIFHANGTDIPTGIMLLIALMLAGFGLIMFLVERWARHSRSFEEMRTVDATAIGLAQTLALFPGVSRSGSTITAGMALGFRRDVAARFSFLLSVPVIFGAGMKSLVDVAQDWGSGALNSSDLTVFLAGILSAGISGYLCIHFLLRFLRTRSTMLFVIYRWVLAAAVVIVALWRA